MDDLSFSVITCSRHSSISLSQTRRAVGMTICSTVTKRLISIFALMGPIYATLFNEMSLKRVLTLSLKPFTKNFYISRNFFCPSGFRISSSSEIVSIFKVQASGPRIKKTRRKFTNYSQSKREYCIQTFSAETQSFILVPQNLLSEKTSLYIFQESNSWN